MALGKGGLTVDPQLPRSIHDVHWGGQDRTSSSSVVELKDWEAKDFSRPQN